MSKTHVSDGLARAFFSSITYNRCIEKRLRMIAWLLSLLLFGSLSISTRALIRPYRVYLLGMMGSGKSTIGKLMADAWKIESIDTDEVITHTAKKSIKDIFSEYGQSYFRQLEEQVVSRTAVMDNVVVSTGGGVVLSEKNWKAMRNGLTIFLDVPVIELARRVAIDTKNYRPLLTSDVHHELQKIHDSRMPKYRLADITIKVPIGCKPEALAETILKLCECHLQAPPRKAEMNAVTGLH